MDEIQKLIEDQTSMKVDEKFVGSRFFPKIFHNLYHNLVDQLRLLTLMDEFADAETSEEMMKISAKAYRLLDYNNYIEKCFEEVKEKVNFKDKDASKELRNQGTMSDDNWKVLDLYTKIISNAPQPSLELAFAYESRSAVLRQLKMYNESLVDIQRARTNGYPREENFKLVLREAQCYRGLGNKEKSTTSLKMAIDDLLNYSGLGKTEIEIRIHDIENEMQQAPCNDSRSEEVIFPDEVPELTYGPSSEVPCASSAVRIEYNDQQGRHLVATKNIKIGDVLLIGENIAGTVVDEHRYQHCAHCHKLCYNLLPCRNCVMAMFCSEQCQAEANAKYHIAECAAYSRFCHLNGKLARGDLMDRIIRLLAIIKIENLTPFFKYARMGINKQDNMSNEFKRTKGFNEQGIFDSSDINTVFNLFSKIDCRETRRYSLITSLFTLQIPRCFGISIKSKDFFPIAGLCLQLENICLMTSVAKTHSNFQYSKMSKTTSVGCFNPLSSLINHSCLGNTSEFTCGNKNVTVAKYPIPKNSILTKPYIKFDPIHSKEQRRSTLFKKYIFHCKCEACENDWPCVPKPDVISDTKDQELANQLSLTATEASLLELHRAVPVARIREEFLQVRFDFLTRMWEKKEYNDLRCDLIEHHVSLMHALQGNRVLRLVRDETAH